jgi:biopolymer transport protein ExbD
MARNRSIRSRKKRNKKKVLDIDITSLLDILVILLVFLLKSYNSSGVSINIPKDISIPNSISDTINSAGVIIQVSKDKIWVDDKEIYTNKSNSKKSFDQGGKRLVPLYNVLVAKKEEVQSLAKQVPEAKPFSGTANLVVDKSLKFSFVKKIMYTCAEAGFRTYKFVVLGNEN